MANISAADVKKLRDLTGAGMMDCKKALTEADGDFEKAKDLITAVVLKSPYALKAPAPIIRIGGLSDSAVILHVRVWTTHEHYWDLYR